MWLEKREVKRARDRSNERQGLLVFSEDAFPRATVMGRANGKQKKEITGEGMRAHEVYDVVEALCEDLRRMGLNATVESKRLGGFSLFSSILGSVRVANRNIDLVELELATGGWEGGDGYRCNYVVQAKMNGLEDRLRAQLGVVRKGFLSREVVDFKWKGRELAQVLNSDANLRDTRYGSLRIEPDKKHQCVRIREISAIGLYYHTPELAFPTIEKFEVCDRIAQHIRSITNVPQ